MSTIIGPTDTHGTWDLAGTPEADTLYGGKGSNRFEGGAGNDTVVYSSDFAGYEVGFDAACGTYRVGRDTLHDIEFIQFGDVTLPIAEALARPGTQHQYGSGDDTLIGSDRGYTLRGDWGNDSFTGNGGDDTLYGGKGEDTALFRGNRADYEIVYDHDTAGFRVTDHVAGRDGVDLVFDIERLKFADTTIQFEGMANTGIHDLDRQPTAADLPKLDGVIGTPPAPLPPQDPADVDIGGTLIDIGFGMDMEHMLWLTEVVDCVAILPAGSEAVTTSIALVGLAEMPADFADACFSTL